MIKSYQIQISIYGKKNKMATIICDNCHKEFDVREDSANCGRKYCDEKCSDEGRFKKDY